MQITEPHTSRYPLFDLGFRPFFLMGSVFAIIAAVLWTLSYQFNLPILPNNGLGNVHWHAHEMIYGYAMAVIAGFLLTAVKNWTGVQTTHGFALFVLAGIWVLARLMPYLPISNALAAMAIFDLLFNLLVCVLILLPIARVKQWQHMGVWATLGFLFVGNLLFYLGLFDLLDNGIRIGLYTGLYTIVLLVMLMGYRVIPFFIEKGVGYPVKLKHYPWINVVSLLLMLVFLISEVYYPLPMYAAVSAILLASIHALRLLGWYSIGIWKKPLLWILYIGYSWVIVGFILYASAYFFNINLLLAVHAFAYGCVGMMTIGMMARVALGHTGRDVFNPPFILLPIFLLMLVGSIVRVLLPLLATQYDNVWILLSQLLWILAFMMFTAVYLPVLVKMAQDKK